MKSVQLSKFLKIKTKPSRSPGLSLDLTDFQKLVRDAGFVGLGAAITYMMSNIMTLNLGSSTLIAIPLITTLLNLAYRWVRDNGPQNQYPDNNNYNNGNDFRPDFTPDVPMPRDEYGRER